MSETGVGKSGSCILFDCPTTDKSLELCLQGCTGHWVEPLKEALWEQRSKSDGSRSCGFRSNLPSPRVVERHAFSVT